MQDAPECTDSELSYMLNYVPQHRVYAFTIFVYPRYKAQMCLIVHGNMYKVIDVFWLLVLYCARL